MLLPETSHFVAYSEAEHFKILCKSVDFSMQAVQAIMSSVANYPFQTPVSGKR